MMRGAASPRSNGFTILELMIAGSIMVIALMGVYLTFDNTWATYSRGQGRAEVQQNARVAMDQMTRQIRMAGYFPENYAPPPPPAPQPPVCPAAVPAAPPLANPLHVATDSALAIYGDADGTCQSQTLPASNVFLFCMNLDLSNPARPTYLLRRVRSTAPFTAAAYTCAGGDILADFPAQSGTSLRFTYYDANGTLLPTPLDGQVLGAVPNFAVTTQRAAARRVLISLAARRDVPSREPQTYMLTSDVRLRNLVP